MHRMLQKYIGERAGRTRRIETARRDLSPRASAPPTEFLGSIPRKPADEFHFFGGGGGGGRWLRFTFVIVFTTSFRRWLMDSLSKKPLSRMNLRSSRLIALKLC